MIRIFCSCLFIIIFSNLTKAQTADVTSGCVPLEVNFDAPELSNYYWILDANATSILKQPTYIFSNAGEFRIELYEGEGGPFIGFIDIKVLPDIEVNIFSDIDGGCIPLTTNWTSQIIKDEAILIENLRWTFGDGRSSTMLNPSHTYQIPGEFDLSIQLETNFKECDKTVTFEDRILADDLNSEILVPEGKPCSAPYELSYIASIPFNPTHSYQWNFGNGETSNAYEPELIRYDTPGKVEVCLTIESPSGCKVKNAQEFIIGELPISLIYPDTVCLGEEFTIQNFSAADRYEWLFGEPPTRSFNRNLTTQFSTKGLKNFSLTISLEDECEGDTSFQIFVESPNSNFNLDPVQVCSDTVTRFLIAEDQNLSTYIWNDINTNTPRFLIEPINAPRDTLHINLPDTIKAKLEVISASGCIAETYKEFQTRLLESYFHVNRTKGIRSMTVKFKDLSESVIPIARKKWLWGDNTESEVDPLQIEFFHDYDTCGLYYPKLIIEDIEGCIDTSKSVELEIVGCFNPSTGTGIDIEGDSLDVIVDTIPNPPPLCVNDSLRALFGTLLDYHLETDASRFDHCWTDRVVSHALKFPGSFPTELFREYKGLELSSSNRRDIEVLGARSYFNYETNCSSPLTVKFFSESINANKLEWYINENLVSTENEFEFTFDNYGSHFILLRAADTNSPCDPDEDFFELTIPQPIAAFQIPSQICEFKNILLDATASVDVDESCHTGYKWTFENQRPRETQSDTLRHAFVRGKQEVVLTVTDLLGCKTSTSQMIQVYGIDPDFDLDSLICLPYEKQFTDLSFGDTTIVGWNWGFGSKEQNPYFEFDSIHLEEDNQDSLLVTLELEDAWGCKASIEKIAEVINPRFFIGILDGTRICAGNDASFEVVDTSDIISDYNFTWHFGDATQDTGLVVTHSYQEPDTLEVTLSYVHKNGSCEKSVSRLIVILPGPEAKFSSDKDEVEIICYPEQIQFFSDSALITQDFDFEWIIDEQLTSKLANPIIEFGAGIHEVKQVVINDIGCTDTLSQFYELVGPLGFISASDSILCPDQALALSLVDTSNVSSYTFDMGDGNTVNNEPVENYIYQLPTNTDSVIIKLLLKSEQFGCEIFDSIPIYFDKVNASFINQDSLGFCSGRVRLMNTSEGADSYSWDFGNGLNSTAENPEANYEVTGEYNILLTATNSETGCQNIEEQVVLISNIIDDYYKMPNVFSPNNDGHNDLFGPSFISEFYEDQSTIIEFKIYNRWGELVFDNENKAGWDGRINGTAATPEVYAYFIQIDVGGCLTGELKGNVTLVR